jgi:hypothetical protein
MFSALSVCLFKALLREKMQSENSENLQIEIFELNI